MATSSLTVDAVSLSVGTRKAIRTSPPDVALFGLMVTWAPAVPAKPSTASAVATTVAPATRSVLLIQRSSPAI